MGQLNSNHPVLLSLVLSLCFIGNAWGEVEVDYRGYLEVDNRFSVPGKKNLPESRKHAFFGAMQLPD